MELRVKTRKHAQPSASRRPEKRGETTLWVAKTSSGPRIERGVTSSAVRQPVVGSQGEPGAAPVAQPPVRLAEGTFEPEAALGSCP